MKKNGSKWPMFILALAGVILAAAIVIVSRKGVSLESSGALHNRPTVAAKVGFLACVILLGLFENWVIGKRNR